MKSTNFIPYLFRVPPDGAPASHFTDNNKKNVLSVNKTNQKSSESKGTSDKKNAKSELLDGNNDDDDGLGNLRKLLKEGKIIGLNDKPPTFTPPSPPAKLATSSTKPNDKKQKAPSPGNKNKKEKRLAPPPPADDEIQACLP